MTLSRSILFVSAMGLAVSGAFANSGYSDYAQERGASSSAIPPSVDETGTVRSPTSLDEDYGVADVYDDSLSAPAAGASADPDLQEHSLASLDESFDQFDANNDGMIDREEFGDGMTSTR